MHVVIFEGSNWGAFAPLSLSRPIFRLITGMSELLDKQIRYLAPTRLTLWVRPEMKQHVLLRVIPRLKVPTQVNVPLDDEPALLVNGRMLLLKKYHYPKTESAVVGDDGRIREALVKKPGLESADVLNRTDRWRDIANLPRIEPQVRVVTSIWDLINWNEESMIEDFVYLRSPAETKPSGPFHFVQEQDISIAPDAKLEPGCVLDASNGPIVVAEHAKIGANAVLHGPCYIGRGAEIRSLACIRPGASIGPMCRVGGEVSNSILLGWSNKSHEGFLGDSYLGNWVNFGAGTITSNLKNTYGEINLKMGAREIPTGRRFLGSIVGDHAKTAIGARLMAGTYAGFCSMIGTSAAPPRFIPSFAWLTDRGLERYDAAKASEVIARVYARRDRRFTPFDQQILDYVAKVAPTIEST